VRLVAPYLVVGAGYFLEVLPDGASYAAARGRSTALGLGFQANVWRGLGVRLEYLVRIDATSGNEEGRVFVSYTPAEPPLLKSGTRVSSVVYAMKPLRGVWHFAEPGYGLRTLSPLTARDGIALDVAVFHWRILNPERPFGYSWDTRAALLMPGWRRGYSTGTFEWHTRLGPAVSIMIEGPDRGSKPGTYGEAGAGIELGPIRIETGIGWLWLSRQAGASVPGTDQHAILLSGGLGF
jgi:hypothetical protein